MKQTEQYQLSQWEQEDRILREDFNADNAKIDAALAALAGRAKIVTGTYTGTGAYSLGNPNTLTFDFVPQMVLVSSTRAGKPAFFTLLFPGSEYAWVLYYSQSSSRPHFDTLNLTWDGTRVSWISGSDAYAQGNAADITYHYVAFA